ncbi:MAG: hypothetical protein AAGI52_15880 [Bacteroidota bacterium]
MGKSVLLAVLATTVLTVGIGLSFNRSGLTSAETQARDEQSLLAEEAARSGLTMTASRLTREFDTWRGGLPVTDYGGGSFVTATRGPVTGPVQVYAAGVVDGVDAQMTLQVARLASAPAALVVQSDSVDVSLSAETLASGIDHGPGGREGRGQGATVHGVWTSSEDASDAFLNALGSNDQERIRGIVDEADVHRAALPGEHAALLAEALPVATDAFTGSQTFSNRQFGSDDAPAIVRIGGDATFYGGGGVGLLYVQGDFVATGDFQWRGVVIVEKEGTMAFRMEQNAEILGATYVLHIDSGVGDIGLDAFVNFQTLPTRTGYVSSSGIATWPDRAPVTVLSSNTTTAPTGTPITSGSTLQAFLGLANLSGVDLDPDGIMNVSYKGPTQMPMFDIRPASGAASSTSEVTLQFGAQLPPGPLYLYIADLDWVPVDITPLSTSGTPLSAASWTKSLSVDLLAPDEGNRTVLTQTASGARLTPNTPLNSDSEVIIDEILIPDASTIASLRFQWTSMAYMGDYAGISISTQSVFAPVGKLNVQLQQNAAIRYSEVEIGRLAQMIPAVRARSEITSYDYRSVKQVDRATVRGPSASDTYTYCKGGVSGTAPTLIALLTEQLSGATPGTCAP